MAQFEVADAAGKGASVESTRQILSSHAADLNTKDAAVKVGSTAAADGVTQAAKTAAEVGEVGRAAGKEANHKEIGKHLGEKAVEGANKIGHGVGDALIKKGGGIAWGDRLDCFPPYKHHEITDKDRTEAKEKLAGQLSDLIPEKDREALKNLHAGLIDGNLDGMKKALNALSDDPARLAKFLKEFNTQLSKSGAGVELSQDGAGNVLIYDKFGGNTAVSINPKTGDTTLRAIERQNDGSVVLKPGEIINRQAGDVMKSLGDEATRNMTQINYIKPMPMDPRPYFLNEKPTYKDSMELLKAK